jgi:hypothetical protein
MATRRFRRVFIEVVTDEDLADADSYMRMLTQAGSGMGNQRTELVSAHIADSADTLETVYRAGVLERNSPYPGQPAHPDGEDDNLAYERSLRWACVRMGMKPEVRPEEKKREPSLEN